MVRVILLGIAVLFVTAADCDPTPPSTAPTADAGGPYQGFADIPIAFDGSGSRQGTSPIQNYFWTFGDGDPREDNVRPMHTYAKPSTPDAVNTFTATLLVVNGEGLSATDQAQVTVERLKADAGGVNGVVEGRAGGLTAFDGSGSEGPTTIDKWFWDFAHGEEQGVCMPGTDDISRCRWVLAITPVHNYFKVDVPCDGMRTWTVTLIVTDDRQVADTATVQALIENDYSVQGGSC